MLAEIFKSMETNSVIEILIDRSGSMGTLKKPDKVSDYKIDGCVRMHLIKKMLLENILPMISEVKHVNVRTFRTKSVKINGKIISTPDIATLFNDKVDILELSKRIISLESPLSGGTPIAAALEVAEQNLKKFLGFDKKIILLTDGEENDGGNFIEVANRILTTLENCKIFIIGIALDDKIQHKVIPIATGGYFNIQEKDFSSQEVRKKLKSLSESLTNDTIEKLYDEKLRIEELIKTGIDATTLTIDDDYSADICKITEELTYSQLCNQYTKDKVLWMNEFVESYKPYDFIILNSKNEILFYIECKGTPSLKPTFYMTEKEWLFFLSNKDKYFLFRISNTANTPIIKSFNLQEAFMSGLIMPMLIKPEILKPNRIFLTIQNVG